MAEMKVETWEIGRLIAYENNPRKNDHAVAQLAAAIRKFGFRVPVLVRSGGEVIDGHLRLKAAIAADLLEVPVVVADDMSEAQVRAFRISVNRMAEQAYWDLDRLKFEVDGLAEAGIPIEVTGFAPKVLEDMFQVLEPIQVAGSKEIKEGEFDHFNHKCGNCGFEFD